MTTVADIAREVNGVVEGDDDVRITGVAGLEDAASGDISFLSNPRYAPAVAQTRAGAVLVPATWEGTSPCALVRVENPDGAFAAVTALFAPPERIAPPGVHEAAVVADDVVLGLNISIGPCAVVEAGVKIGHDTIIDAGCHIGHETEIGHTCRLYPHVSVRERTRIGHHVIIHNGAVIGSDGFGYTHAGDGWEKIPQIGSVRIGDHAEIGANVTIDRARFGTTVIGNGVKIDNLVQIAHNVVVGDHTAIAAQAGISGSTRLGRNVQVAGQVGFAGHLTVGDGAVIGGGAGVTKDVAPATFVSGYPAMPHSKARRLHAHVMRLPDMKRKMNELEKDVAAIRAQMGASS